MNSLTGTLANDHTRRQLCRRVLAVGGLVLIAVTRPLWFSMYEFPQVPWFEFLCPTPQWVDWCLSAALVVLLLAMAILPADKPSNLRCGGASVLLWAMLIALNQHRLQPWAWFIMIGTLATNAREDYSLRWMRWLVFGVYFFSGLSKLEPSFAAGGGNWLLDGMLMPFGQSSKILHPKGREFLLWLMPAIELAMAFFVVIPPLRKWGLFPILAMHGALIFALGPWGLNHKPGVLIWNGMFQVLAFPLLWPKLKGEPQPNCVRSRALGAVVVLTAIVLPCFGQRWKPIVDQWPSWSVYATWDEEEPKYLMIPDGWRGEGTCLLYTSDAADE